MALKFKQKLISSKGASITFALLLFLVCAVVGSVVLAAGTAASGRFSKLAESDARYYSVTSAVDLLRDSFDGATASKTEVTKTILTETTVYPAETLSSDSRPDEDGYVPDSFTGDGIFLDAIKSLGVASSRNFSLVHSFSGEYSGYVDSMKVSVKEQLKANGDIVLTVSSGSEDEMFAVDLTFEAKKSESSSSITEEISTSVTGDPSTSPDFSKVVVSRVTETKVTAVEWNLTSIRRSSGV